MLITTHTLATIGILAGAKLLGVDVTPKVMAVSLVAGVFMDLDHILFHPRETFRKSCAFLKDPKRYQTGQAKNTTFLHQPISALIFLILTIISGFSFIPLVCFATHIFMDALVFERKLIWPLSDKTFKNPFAQNIKRELIAFVVLMPSFIFFLI